MADVKVDVPPVEDGGVKNSDDVSATPDGIPLDTIGEKKPEGGVPPAGKPPGPGEMKTLMTGAKLALLFIGLAMAIFLAALDQTIVSTATPVITRDLHSFSDFSWISTAYLLTSTALQPLYGKFSDIFGRKSVTLFAIFTFELGSLLCAVSQNINMLIAARAIAGIGGAGLFSMVFIVISDVVNPRDRGKYQGIVGAMFGLASIAGPLLGGAFTENVSWRWCFYINLPLGAITVVVVVLFLNIPYTPSRTREKLARIDYFGVLTLVPGITCMLLATAWGGSTYAWNSGQVIALYIVSGFLILAFVLVEIYVAKEPLLPMKLFTIRNFVLCSIISFVLGYCLLGSTIYLPVYFQEARGYSPTSSGLRILPLAIGLVLMSIMSGGLIARTGVYAVFPIIGMALCTLGMGMQSLLKVDSNFGQMVGLLIPTGVGLGLCLQSILLAVQACVPLSAIAVGTASVQFFRNIGAVVGVAVNGAIMNNQLARIGISNGGGEETTGQLPLPVEEAFVKAIELMFWVAIPIAGIGFILSLFIQWIPLKKTLGAGPPAMAE
jgi:EmrB/QacA subfamily drug resistance transporter